jgi:hypothetical protein
MRFNSAVIASVLILSLVTGCNKEDQGDADVASTPMVVRKKPKTATPNATASATPGAAKSPAGTANTNTAKAKPKAAPANAGKATAKANDKQTLAKLNGYLPAAVKALQANDVATAKQYAKSFNDNWQQKIIQSSVKAKSQDSYNKIAAGVTQVNNALKPANPDKAKASAALQSLSQAVTQYTQSP